MSVEEDELKRIRLKKMRELMRRVYGGGVREKVEKPSINKPIEVTDRNFGEIIRSHPLVVIDCWAPWCPPCRIIAPIIEDLARDYAGKILFGKLNVDENHITPMRYQIMSIPTLLVFKNGRLVDRIIGAMPRRMLEPRITRHL